MHTDARAKERKLVRSTGGINIIEATVGLVIGLPALVAIIFVAVEVCSYFLIQSNLDAATRKAARDMAMSWGQDPTTASDPTKQQAVYTNCLINGYVNSTAQFSDPVFNGVDPPTVTVVGTYTSGQYGLGQFPHPNPLNIGSDFVIHSEATYRLE